MDLKIRRMDPLPGRSSRALATQSAVFLATFPLLLAAAILLNQLGADPANAHLEPLFALIVAVLLGTGFSAYGSYFAMRAKAKAERAAGYSFINDEHTEVALIDHKTFVVLREPGEPQLNELEYHRRRDIARSQWARITSS